MRRFHPSALSGLIGLALLIGVSAGPAASASPTPSPVPSSCPWLNQSLPVSQRVQLLLSQMTLADKISMVTGAGTSEPYVFYTVAIPSLCIPAMGLEDGPNGVGDGLTGVTELPAGVSLAATWDNSLAQSYGQVIGSEELGKGAMVNLGPTVNVDRDPRWGRSFEAFTEDPELNSALAVAEIDGVQSTGEMSQVKHLAVYNQETNRNTPADNAIVSERAEHEIYLPAFYAATEEANAASVMCAYSTINGEAACQNSYLMNTTLDQRWDYPGFVTSDYDATHSTVASADAGLDQEMPSAEYYGPALEAAVESGQVSMATLNGMVSRILTEMFQFGEFNHPPTGTPSSVVTSAAHQAVATQVAEAGTVLLQNTGGVLPLSASNAGTVAVIGPAASVAPTDTGGGSAYVTAPFSVTPLQGIQAAAGSGTSVEYEQGLPADTALPAIPSSDLSPAYTGTGYGQTYTGTLTAPETGTYVLAFQNPGSYTVTNLSLDGAEILANPGTPPVSTYSVAVDLTAGQTYTLQLGGGGPSANLTWATPTMLASYIDPAVSAATSAGTAVVVVSDDTESEAADRASLDLPSAQNLLISSVAAANPRTVVVIDAGAPVLMPWLSQVAGVIDAWYPGESNGTALAAVLFGSVDPGGHLPVTFPQSLSQVPASTPAEFPGVGGNVQYSEGIDVGYRYYGATDETPLFPFGYGLSYTTFGFSHLRVTPQVVNNRSSGPGESSCNCNGQGTQLVTVSATVTNTGSVAGSDVAQLYLGDPAAAAEPPEQLKGFDKVQLNPGQSTTVHFTLNGHDLSYWDDTANGWVVPDGSFNVYVGDSSAPANLPLTGSFTVGRSIGARYATISAPSTANPESTITVNASFVNDGDYSMDATRFTLQTPSGWTVQGMGGPPHEVAPGQTVQASWQVGVPLAAQATAATITARATFAPSRPGSSGSPGPPPANNLVEASTSITIAPAVTVSISPTSVIVPDGGSGSAQLTYQSNLSSPLAVTVTPSPPAGISASPSPGTVTVPPQGTTSSLEVSVGSTTPGGAYPVPVNFTFQSAGATYALSAVQLTVSVPFTSLAAAFDDVGITDNSNTAPGNYDGVGSSFSEEYLTASGLAPGATVYQNGTLLTWPDVPAGEADNVVSGGQTIELTGSGTDLVLLDASDYGAATGDVTVTYTDGTTETHSIGVPDWYSDAASLGSNLVAQTLTWNRQPGDTTGPHAVSIYSTVIPLASPTKTVKWVTLPNISSGVAGGETAMHVFAMALGSGSAAASFASLAAAYDNVAISDNSDPTQANYDGSGFSFSEEALTAATPSLAPGATVSEDGATLTWPNVSSGQPDAVLAEGQTVDISGSGTNLVLLGAANNGTATGIGTINYTDGSTQSFTISLADWYADAPATGDGIVATTSDWNQPPGSTLGSHMVSVYWTAVALMSGKTVASVVLPDVNTGIGNGTIAMHIFAMAIGP